MELEGKVIQYLGETGGTSNAGKPWKKKEWIVETFGQYPKKVKVQCFGTRAETINLEPGKDYVLSIDLESREYQGRWYTDVTVYRYNEYAGPGPLGGQQPPIYNNPAQTAPQGVAENDFGTPPFGGTQFTPSEEGEEDLPF